MKTVVTGAAGFIGSTLADRLLKDGHYVLGLDNFSTGKLQFLEQAQSDPNFECIEIDLLDSDSTIAAISKFAPDTIIHLAANADVRFGLEHPRKDLEQGVIVTHNVLEAARVSGVKKFAYSSTGSVYGEPEVFPTPESCPFPVQTSLYGASKLAGEAMVQAYAEGFGIQAIIFRFVSILGPRYTHGHIFDFIKKLKSNSTEIHVLGNGEQRKAYLHIEDCIDAITTILHQADSKVSIYNLGPDETCTVNDSLNIICKQLELSPKRIYAGGIRGWVGDSPFIFLDCAKLRQLGWKPKFTIENGVKDTVRYLLNHSELFDPVSGALQ